MTTPAQSKERLLKLAWLLDNLTTEFPGAKFSLDRWITKLIGKFNGRPVVECGTTACACGWAGMYYWFRRRGLRSVVNYNPFHSSRYGLRCDGAGGWSAVRGFFGVDQNDAQKLFSVSEYRPGKRGRHDVARRIRKFVKEAA